jgi:hypothetical protein
MIEANKIIENIDFNLKYKVFIDTRNIFSIGVIKGIEIEDQKNIDIDDIKAEINGEKIKIMNFEPMYCYNFESKKLELTNNIKITFRSVTLPKTIKLLYIIKNVHLFENKLLLCSNCWKYGHI